MHKVAGTLAFLVLAAGLVPAQEAKDDSLSLNGDVESYDVKLFPNQKKSGNLVLGAFRTADEWEAFWKKQGEKSPKVDFEKNVVVYVMNQVYGGTVALEKPCVDRGTATFAVDAKDRNSKKSFRCHYPYSLRSIAMKDIRTIEFKEKGKEKDEALCKIDPLRPEDRKSGVE